MTPELPHPSLYRPFGTFRFGLAMLVLLQHCLLLLPFNDRGGFYQLELGAVAVTVFFALSGFIVAEALSTFYARRPWAFLANRVVRVVPPYLAVLLLTILIDSWLFYIGRLNPLDAPMLSAPWQPAVILAGMCEIIPGLPSWRISGQDFSFIPFAWTLRIEFAFYLAAFVTTMPMRQTRPPHPFRQSIIVGGAVATAYLVFGIFLARHGQGPQQILCIPFFGFGLGVFWYRQQPKLRSTILLCGLAVLVPIAFTFWQQRGDPVLAYQLPVVGALCLMLFLLSGVIAMPENVRRLDKRLGDLSYPLYIGHGCVLVALSSLSDHRGWWLYWLGVAGALAFARLIHATIEYPLRRVRDRLRGTPL